MSELTSRYDVVVIGAGPTGIYSSIKLAESGLRVLVLEEDSEVGKPKFCTGLISKETFDGFCLPRESIENEFFSARICSPLGSEVYLKSRNNHVYVADRAVFDQGLYQRAKEIGVEFLLNCRCTGLKINRDYVTEKIILDNIVTEIKSTAVVLATGIKYNLHSCAGLPVPSDFLDSSQVQLTGTEDNGIEIFVGNSVAPHSFAWIVPLKENKLRIGLSTNKNSPFFLKAFLKNLESKGRINRLNPDIARRPIPLGVINKTYGYRILVVGDAAGQVKPTTGGGVYFGLLCADLAAQTIIDAFKHQDFSSRFLRRYEIKWKKKIEFDLVMSMYLRKLLVYLNDEQIEKLLRFCSGEPVLRLIEKYADFNHHGRFIKELIIMPAFWKTLYEMLSVK